MKSISIIIPVYNELDNIRPLYNEIIEAIFSKIKFEIIYVDDGSNDGTDLLLKTLQKDQVTKIIKHRKNLGQSQSLLSGIINAKYDTIVTIDGDGQNIPQDINKLTDIFFSSNNLGLVSGIRIKRQDNMVKIISSKIANFIRSIILKDNCPDTGCGLKIFSKNFFLSLPFFDGIHRFLPALFMGFGYKVEYIRVGHRPRIHGVSKYGTFVRLIRGIRDIIKVAILIKSVKKNNNK